MTHFQYLCAMQVTQAPNQDGALLAILANLLLPRTTLLLRRPLQIANQHRGSLVRPGAPGAGGACCHLEVLPDAAAAAAGVFFAATSSGGGGWWFGVVSVNVAQVPLGLDHVAHATLKFLGFGEAAVGFAVPEDGGGDVGVGGDRGRRRRSGSGGGDVEDLDDEGPACGGLESNFA